MNVIVKL